MWPNPQETTDLVTFTEEIFNGKFLFFFGQCILSMLKTNHAMITSPFLISSITSWQKYIEISTFWQRKMRSSTAEHWQKIKKCNLLALIVGVGHFPVIFSIRIFFKWSLQFTGQHVTIFILLHFGYEMTTSYFSSLCL